MLIGTPWGANTGLLTPSSGSACDGLTDLLTGTGAIDGYASKKGTVQIGIGRRGPSYLYIGRGETGTECLFDHRGGDQILIWATARESSLKACAHHVIAGTILYPIGFLDGLSVGY